MSAIALGGRAAALLAAATAALALGTVTAHADSPGGWQETGSSQISSLTRFRPEDDIAQGCGSVSIQHHDLPRLG